MTIHYIYQIVNSVNNKKYIGYTSKTPPEKRWDKHIVDRYTPATKDRPLYRALRKYGIENFKFEILYCSKDASHTLKTMENYFIEQQKSYITENGYNLTKGGDSNYGWQPNDKTRELWSLQRKGKPLSDAHKKKISEGQKLRYVNHPELRKFYRELAIKNHLVPPKATKESGRKSGMTRTGGHIHTEEHKQHLRKLFKDNEHPLQAPKLMEKRKETWKKTGRNVGAKNPLAVFCNVFNPCDELVGCGYLRDVCMELNAPFNKFSKAARHGNALQRGEWKGWKIVKIPRD